MTTKRSHIEIDPDYEDVSEVQNKRRRVIEEGGVSIYVDFKNSLLVICFQLNLHITCMR